MDHDHDHHHHHHHHLLLLHHPQQQQQQYRSFASCISLDRKLGSGDALLPAAAGDVAEQGSATVFRAADHAIMEQAMIKPSTSKENKKKKKKKKKTKKQGDEAAINARSSCKHSPDHNHDHDHDHQQISTAIAANSANSAADHHRNCINASAAPVCQIEGCVNRDLSKAKKDYHRRHKVCEIHSKAPLVIKSGLAQRFCQQCSRFHVVSEFDDAKRSCRRRLEGHNRRRRKPAYSPAFIASAASLLQLGSYHDKLLQQLVLQPPDHHHHHHHPHYHRPFASSIPAMAFATTNTAPSMQQFLQGKDFFHNHDQFAHHPLHLDHHLDPHHQQQQATSCRAPLAMTAASSSVAIDVYVDDPADLSQFNNLCAAPMAIKHDGFSNSANSPPNLLHDQLAASADRNDHLHLHLLQHDQHQQATAFGADHQPHQYRDCDRSIVQLGKLSDGESDVYSAPSCALSLLSSHPLHLITASDHAESHDHFMISSSPNDTVNAAASLQDMVKLSNLNYQISAPAYTHQHMISCSSEIESEAGGGSSLYLDPKLAGSSLTMSSNMPTLSHMRTKDRNFFSITSQAHYDQSDLSRVGYSLS